MSNARESRTPLVVGADGPFRSQLIRALQERGFNNRVEWEHVQAWPLTAEAISRRRLVC
jgi:ActR/RegA family two-component response regulator